MRILLVSDEPRDMRMGGAKVALKLQAALRQLGHDCDALFAADLGPWPPTTPLRLACAPLLAAAAVRRHARARRPPHRGLDIIDAASAEARWLPTARRWRLIPPAAIVARSHGLEHRYFKELLADHHAGWLHKPWTRRWWYPLVRLSQVAAAFRSADALIVLNPDDQAFALERRWQPPPRVAVIPHGVDADLLASAPSLHAPRGAGILYCGWWTTSKGVHYLARAHQLLLERGIAAPLTLLGVGTQEPLHAMRARIEPAFAPASRPLLTLLPRLEQEAEVFAHYRRHDILVCPSTSEGFGLAVLEAMSQRLPVVCTTAVGASSLLRNECEALLVPPRDAQALAAALARLWRSVELRRQLAEAAYAVARPLTWEMAARRTLEVYRLAQLQRARNGG